MDPFSRLPLQPSLLILGSLVSAQDIENVSQASQTIFLVYRGHREYIMRHNTTKYLLPGSLLQDALAILRFPRQCQAHERRHAAKVDAHLRAWGAKAIPVTLDITTLLQLNSLYYQVWRYVEDYLNKATSSYLPRAYRHIPAWAHDDFCNSAVQQVLQLKPSLNHPRVKRMCETTRRQIFQAFLRYEILCKVFGPNNGGDKGNDYLPQCDVHCRSVDLEHNEQLSTYSTNTWDWTLLSRYEISDNRDATRRMEPRLLICVREYILLLYEALVADQMQVPPMPEGEPGYDQSEFEPAPNYLGPGWFYRRSVTKNWGKLECMKQTQQQLIQQYPDWIHLEAGSKFTWGDHVISFMASAGLDLLTETLLSSESEFRRTLLGLCRDFAVQAPQIDATSLHSSLPAESPSGTFWYKDGFVRLNRQRAWALFHYIDMSVDGEVIRPLPDQPWVPSPLQFEKELYNQKIQKPEEVVLS